MRPRREVVDFIVVGIGVNINMSREEMNKLMGNVAHIATSIKENLGKDLDRSKFAADLLLELEKWHKIYREKGKSNILREWTERWGDLNKRVCVEYDGESYEGTATGIDGHGYLMVQTDNGEIKQVIAGDVIIL
jgi:BirA family biotin operon repressor/biotin-[acetyl-CoA-carboxylase] ligase